MSDSANERVPLRDGTEGFPEARELPRPATPGPWAVEWDSESADDIYGGVYRWPWRIRGICDFVEEAPTGRSYDLIAQDAAAIAALPEWIEDRDRWKARAEKAEALAVAVLTWVHADEDAASDAALMDAIRAYERHGFADAA